MPKVFKQRIGSKAQVWHGTAKQTPGGVTRAGLVKDGKRIKFKAKVKAAKKNNNLKGHLNRYKDMGKLAFKKGKK